MTINTLIILVSHTADCSSGCHLNIGYCNSSGLCLYVIKFARVHVVVSVHYSESMIF